ncbi:putative quinol monooxygenase [Brucella thiophenivorans]|uniref:Antibiotic biosynthesis monooxygenase family protein n=1 Tax=Brucella thiophenivorans TaxID=571255 RepID=A0A256G0P9_9HYPH|nr:putative quinol monooxygenase [Brucella thiophenivorans]OYR20231.1 antibiotic biosynthesis monooxygenase family protein [Brucella thiophenivorans]
MILIVGTVRLPAENLDSARPIMKRMIEASRAETGCIEYTYAQDVFELGLIHVKELWQDRISLEKHFASDHIAQWRSHWPELRITDHNLVRYEVSAPEIT